MLVFESMSDSFVAQTLNSKQLLALLFICERARKKQPVTHGEFSGGVPADWKEMLETFSPRLANLGETMRFEVLEAHLMSVEDIDVYNNDTISELLKNNSDALGLLTQQIESDARFRLACP